MIVYRSLDEITQKLPGAVVTIGNFDGVHLGHREIFRRVEEAAAEVDGTSVVVTFVPHPLKVLGTKRLKLISTHEEKETLIREAGVDCLVSIPFDLQFAGISAERFVREILVDRIGVKKLIIGYDYAFGRNREGDFYSLRRLGNELGFEVEALEPIGSLSAIYSSSSVRRLVEAGDVAGVVQILGRHYSIAGNVVHGAGRGEGLGYPTANLATEKELLPAEGIYAVKVGVGGEIHDGACSIGVNPTFGGKTMTIEVFLLDFRSDLYGRAIRIYFIERLRGQQAFPSVEELKTAIAADVAACRRILAATPLVDSTAYPDEPR